LTGQKVLEVVGVQWFLGAEIVFAGFLGSASYLSAVSIVIDFRKVADVL